MINISFYKNAFIVEGHANFANKGKDIVCAAISGIVMGSLNWFKKKNIKELVINEDIPLIKLVVNIDSNESKIGISLIHKQLSSIESNYQQYINIKKYQKNL